MVWHPVLATIEGPRGSFALLDGEGHPVAEIVLVRRGSEYGYRAGVLSRADEDTVVVGYFTALLPAVKAAHVRVVSSYAHQGGPIAHWE